MSGREGSSLPTGWAWAKVEDLARSIQYGYTASASKNPDGPRFLRITDIQDGQVEWSQVPTCPIAPDEIPKYALAPGDIVFARTGATTGKSYLIKECPPAVFASYIIRLKMFPEIDSSYVQTFFQSNNYWRQIEEGKRGIGQPNVNARSLGRITFPVPPESEQLRIVSKIEELFSKLDAGVAALKRIKANLKKYRASVLKAAVEGKLTEKWREENPSVEPASKLLERILSERRRRWEADQLSKYEEKGKEPPNGWKEKYKEPVKADATGLPELPDGWCWAEAETLAEPGRPILYGIIKAGPHDPDGVPMVRVKDVVSGSLVISELKRCNPERAAKFSRATLRAHDLVVSKDGTIGRVLHVPPELDGGNISQHVLRFSPCGQIDRRYLAFMLQAPPCQAWMKGETRGVALQGINVDDFRRLPIPLAPPPEQQAIVDELESLLTLAGVVEEAMTVNLQRSTRLRQSILKRAFEGKLVQQDPTDESASELLERIKAEREVATKSLASRGTKRKGTTQKTKKKTLAEKKGVASHSKKTKDRSSGDGQPEAIQLELPLESSKE